MKIAKSERTKYLGFADGFHVLLDTKYDSKEYVREAKIVDVSTDAVFILKDDGNIEPTYATKRKLSNDIIMRALNAVSA